MPQSSPPYGFIRSTYLLVLFSVPFHRGTDGRLYLDPLWAKDLAEHRRYIERLVLAAPVRTGEMPAGAVAMGDVEAFRSVRCVELPPTGGYASALRRLPETWRLLRQAAKGAGIVHTSVASWPIPEAWLMWPIVRLQGCLLYINVESAFWRLVPGAPASAKARVLARLTETLNRWCVEAADISTFTQSGYLTSLLRRNRARGHVVEASWIDSASVLSPAQLALRQARPGGGTLRLVFAGRLTAAKGVRLLLEAIRSTIEAGLDVSLDLFGSGPLEAECSQFARDPRLGGRVRMRGSVAYGEPFFAALAAFHAIVVPTLSDEQPRIVFDAYAQGLPVLASDTAGMAQCVAPGVTGWLFRSGQQASLCEAIARIAQDRSSVDRMAEACIARARASTHEAMHRKRWHLLLGSFPALAADGS